MEGISTLASTGDSPMLFIIGGIIAVALVVLIVALIVMLRKRK